MEGSFYFFCLGPRSKNVTFCGNKTVLVRSSGLWIKQKYAHKCSCRHMHIPHARTENTLTHTYACRQACTHTQRGIWKLADNTILRHSYPLHLICIILIKCSFRSTQPGCQVESGRKRILLC